MAHAPATRGSRIFFSYFLSSVRVKTTSSSLNQCNFKNHPPLMEMEALFYTREYSHISRKLTTALSNELKIEFRLSLMLTELQFL